MTIKLAAAVHLRVSKLSSGQKMSLIKKTSEIKTYNKTFKQKLKPKYILLFTLNYIFILEI